MLDDSLVLEQSLVDLKEIHHRTKACLRDCKDMCGDIKAMLRNMLARLQGIQDPQEMDVIHESQDAESQEEDTSEEIKDKSSTIAICDPLAEENYNSEPSSTPLFQTHKEAKRSNLPPLLPTLLDSENDGNLIDNFVESDNISFHVRNFNEEFYQPDLGISQQGNELTDPKDVDCIRGDGARELVMECSERGKKCDAQVSLMEVIYKCDYATSTLVGIWADVNGLGNLQGGGSISIYHQQYFVNQELSKHGFLDADGYKNNPPTRSDCVLSNCMKRSTPNHLDYEHLNLLQELFHSNYKGFEGTRLHGGYNSNFQDLASIYVLFRVKFPPASAFLKLKCALWNFSRLAQGSEWCQACCNKFHTIVALNESFPCDDVVVSLIGLNLSSNIEELSDCKVDIFLVTSQQYPWLFDKLSSLSGDEAIFFEYKDIMAEYIEKQLVRIDFKICDIHGDHKQDDKVKILQQSFNQHPSCGIMKIYSGKVEVMSRWICINVILLKEVSNFSYEVSRQFDKGNDNSTIIQAKDFIYKLNCDMQGNKSYSFSVTNDQMEARSQVKSKDDFELFHKLPYSGGFWVDFKEDFFKPDVGYDIKINEGNFGEKEERYSYGFPDEVNFKFEGILVKYGCQREYTIMGKFLIFNWGWFYKEVEVFISEGIEECLLLILQSPQSCLHPGCWIVEWKIAWMLN